MSGLTFPMTIAAYVLLALGLQTIAKRRRIRKPWLAWIPVANMWLLGCISDQYRYVARQQEKSKRKLMLTLAIISAISVTVIACISCAMVFRMIEQGVITRERILQWSKMTDEAIAEDFVELITAQLRDNTGFLREFAKMSGFMGIAGMIGGVAAIWLSILQYMAYYDLYKSANPSRTTVYMLFTIFLGNLVTAVLVFHSKDKDDGMPPKQVVVEQPTYVPPTDAYT